MSFKYLQAGLLLSLGSVLYGGIDNAPVRVTPKAARAMDYSALPSDALVHHRTKWSNDLFIYIDDDAGGPSLYMFDRSGKPVFSAMIQIPLVDRTRIDDFAAAPDGSVWVAGNASSRAGQLSFFLAHLRRDRQDAQIIRTSPYAPRQLTVAPDGTVWTVGYDYQPRQDENGQPLPRAEPTGDVLHHFDASGKFIASAIPVATVGKGRVLTGYLIATQDRIGWYSPMGGTSTYVELSSDMKVLQSHPVEPTTGSHSITTGFTLTPAGNAFAAIQHEGGSTLYELNRDTNEWVAVDIPRDARGYIPMLEGNDGESLIFTGLPDKSKLQVFDVSGMVVH